MTANNKKSAKLKCPDCNSSNFVLKMKDLAHIGIYCKSCGKWVKWASKDEQLQYKYVSSEVSQSTNNNPLLKKIISICGERCECCRFMDYESNKCLIRPLVK